MSAFLLQVGTGQRLLDVPGTELVSGGGVRIGWDFGPVAPFLGGNLTRAALEDVENDVIIPGTLWSVTAGARVDLVDETEPLHPFGAAGLILGRAAGRVDYDDGDEVYGLVTSIGPGGFLGAGADARLVPGLAIGLEVGGVVAPADITIFEEFGRDREEFGFTATGIWSYVDLHLVFRPGGGE